MRQAGTPSDHYGFSEDCIAAGPTKTIYRALPNSREILKRKFTSFHWAAPDPRSKRYDCPDSLHRRGKPRPEHIDRLAAALVGFYRSLPPLSFTPQEYRDRYLSHVRGNLRELLAVQRHLPSGVVERVHGFQLQLLMRLFTGDRS